MRLIRTKNRLKIAVEKENEKTLIKCLNFENYKNFDPSQYELIEKALYGKWHTQHEDLISAISFGGLKDDRFVEPIMDIALKGEIFRPFDDELEATLRKCVHALKMIDSEKSKNAIRRLKELNNDNVKVVLEMYKD
ncbi:conserved hypothetical protein [Tenacibaculum litopenaei]|uniref:hypothetical protein n=1 Tax=Tenacibaculum litopenaei TaxID=396016 RepID=UPI0038959F0D